jgi:hypothetical protein
VRSLKSNLIGFIIGSLIFSPLLYASITLTSSSALAVGATPTGGTANRVLFTNGSGVLSDDADLTFLTDTLTATKAVFPTSATIGTVSTQSRAVLSLNDTTSGSSTTSNWINLTGTNPTTLSAAFNAINLPITTTGSSAQTVRGLYLSMLPGYTGATSVEGIRVEHTVNVGSGADPDLSLNHAVNSGIYSYLSHSSGAIRRYSIVGLANAASTNLVVGVFGGSRQAGAGANNGVGVFGFLHNAGTSAGGTYAGFFQYYPNPGYTGTVPVGASALAASNSSTTKSILQLYDNTTRILEVPDGGNVYLGNSAGVAAPASYGLYAEPGTGTNIVGGNLTLSSGFSTGSGTPGRVILQSSETGSSGTTLQSSSLHGDYSQKAYSMTDNTNIPLFTITLATDDTGCSTHFSFMYTNTDATDTVSHAGILICTFINDDGTVTGTCTDTGESITGTGCGAGCDAWPVTVASTTATVNGDWDNTLTGNPAGSLRYSVLNNSCRTYARQ